MRLCYRIDADAHVMYKINNQQKNLCKLSFSRFGGHWITMPRKRREREKAKKNIDVK